MTGGAFSFGAGRFRRGVGGRPISRAGLLGRLDGGRGVVVVAGGAGAGKSTLLDAWVAGRGGTLVDLSEEAVGDWGAVLRERTGVLAVDGGAAHDVAALRDLVGPGGPSVVVAVDEDPGGEHEVIGSRALAFAEDETYQVLAGAFGDAEAADALAPDLHLLTHGWPALVALAGAWLARYPGEEHRERLRALARAEEGLAEFLVPALVGGLDADERETVRRLVRLPALDARLADLLDVTEDLQAVAPFVQGLGRRPGWYVVPDVWRGALARELPMAPGEVAELRAAYRAAAR